MPRFILLIALVIAAGLSALQNVNLILSYQLKSGGDVLGPIGCYYAAGVDPVGDPELRRRALLRPGVSDALDACWDRFAWRLPFWQVLLEAALLITAVVALYWLLPRWKARRTKVVPLDEEIDPTGEVRRAIDELVAVAGLSRPPRIVVDPAAHTPSAVVFGRWRRYTICLHGGLLARRTADPAGFRGVVLHELAHIRNRDVDITYGTVALWRVFLAVPLPAHVLIYGAYLRRDLPRYPEVAPARINIPDSVHELLHTGLLIALVYLARADVLRAREFYADADAARWGADPRVWRQGPAIAASGGRIGRSVKWFAGLWRTHPEWAQRERALADPVRLFGVQRLPIFLTGAAAIIVAREARFSLTLGQSEVPGWAQWACAMLAAGLAALIIGMILWRAASYAVLTGRRGPSGVRAGLWFGAGLLVGGLGQSRALGQWLPERPQFLLLLFVIGVLVGWWTAQHAELWARTWHGRSLGPVMLLGLVATWLVFGLWFSWWQSDGHAWAEGRAIVNSEGVFQLYAARMPGLAEADTDALRTILAARWTLGRLGTDQFVLSSERYVMWVAAATWLLPLLTCLLRRTSAAPRWARADQVRTDTGLPMRRIMRCGIGGGLSALGALVMSKAILHDAVLPEPGRLAATILYDSFGGLVTITAAMVVAAWVAGNGDRTHRLLTGLVTAGLTALLGLLWAFLLRSMDGCLGRLDVVFDTCEWRPYEGWSHAAEVGQEVLGLSMFAVAVALLLVPGIPRRATPTADGSETALLRRRVLVAVVWITTGAFISTSGLPLTPVASAAPDGITPAQARLLPAASPSDRSLMVLAWLRYGGQEHMNGIAKGENAFATAASRSFSYEAVAAQVRPVCRDIERGVAEARAYFPVPDDEGQRLWTEFLNESEEAAENCLEAIDTESAELYRTAQKRMFETYFSHQRFFKWTGTFTD